MAYIDVADLVPFAEISEEKAVAMVQDATAQAVLAAPCLGTEDDLTDAQKAAVKSILRGAILRWHDAGSGAFQQDTQGPFSVTYDTRQTRKALFWPSEIAQLQSVCSAINGGKGGAFEIDPGAGSTIRHSETCSLRFGANYCSCGAILTGRGPLW